METKVKEIEKTYNDELEILDSLIQRKKRMETLIEVKKEFIEGLESKLNDLKKDRGEIFERCFKVINYIAPETELNEKVHGWISEIDFIEIIMELEKEFDCSIEEGEIGVENFETVNDMVKWLTLQIK